MRLCLGEMAPLQAILILNHWRIQRAPVDFASLPPGMADQTVQSLYKLQMPGLFFLDNLAILNPTSRSSPGITAIGACQHLPSRRAKAARDHRHASEDLEVVKLKAKPLAFRLTFKHMREKNTSARVAHTSRRRFPNSL